MNRIQIIIHQKNYQRIMKVTSLSLYNFGINLKKFLKKKKSKNGQKNKNFIKKKDNNLTTTLKIIIFLKLIKIYSIHKQKLNKLNNEM